MNLPKKKSRSDRFSSALGFPDGALSKSLYIQLYSSSCVNIEGNCTVLNYTDCKININAPDGIISVCGENLAIDEFSVGNLNITGSIKSVSFC